MKKSFQPQFHTPFEKLCKEELNKYHSNGMRGNLAEELRDFKKPDIVWEAEQLAKSYGVYLEFNRAKTGSEKEWIYMLRLSNPSGGPIQKDQWLLLDELSDKYARDPHGHSSIRLTTRQNIQFHWVNKQGVLAIVKALAEKGLNSINGCGDNMRNVMGCPLSRHSDIFDASAWARKAADYFQLPLDPFIEIFAIDPHYIRKPEKSFPYGPQLLNRKFKIGFSAVHKDPVTGELFADNCVELLTHDLSVAPIIEQGEVTKFQVYVGGGQGERNGKPSLATLGLPFALVSEGQLLHVLDAVVQVHQECGDRQNRVWARLKYVIKKMGIDWFRDQVTLKLGFPLEKPDPEYDYGRRHLHLGWHVQPNNGMLACGIFIENGRIIDQSPNGRLKCMVKAIIQKYPVELMVTPNQDLLFCNIPASAKEEFQGDLEQYGYGRRNGSPYSKLRIHSGACVGRDTCRLTYTDSEKFEPFLIDKLEKLGWGEMTESVGVTGCERQCFRPATKTIGLVGSGLNRYQFKLMGDETARFQGQPIISKDGTEMYLRSVEREKVPVVIHALFQFYKKNAQGIETMGSFHRRIGMPTIISHLKNHSDTADLMKKTFSTDCVMT